MIAIKRGGGVAVWKSRGDSPRWGFLAGGYMAVSVLGLRFLQVFRQWGSATAGEQREAIARLELELKPRDSAALLHVELFNLSEARIVLVNLRVWRGWTLSLIVNLGVRFTKAAQTVRMQKEQQRMRDRARAEQARRIEARRMAQQMARQRQGRPWPPRTR